MSEHKTPLWAHCEECQHSWIAFFLPIRLDLISRFKHVHCPMCASAKVFCGKAKDETTAHP